jgi:acetyl-CoA acetyltransferase
MSTRRAAIVAPMRTPVGTFGGSLRDVPVEDLAATAVKGSGISLGHPIGATGARMLATGLRELRRRGGRYLLETMCVGGGQGVAAVFETA